MQLLMRKWLIWSAVPLITAMPLAAQDDPKPQNPQRLFRFGLVADIQYADKASLGKRKYRESLEYFQNCAADWGKQNLDFTWQLGDLIDGRETPEQSKADLQKVLLTFRQLNVPNYHVVGNHCLAVSRRELLQALNLPAAYYSWQQAGWRFIVLDSLEISLCGVSPDSTPYQEARAWLEKHPQTKYPNSTPWNGGMSSSQLDWLCHQLQAAQDLQQNVVIGSHLPTLEEASSAKHLLWNHREVLSHMDRYSCIVAFLSGHDHSGGYAIRRGVHHWTLPAMVEASLEANAYAIVDVFRDRLEISGRGKVKNRVFQVSR